MGANSFIVTAKGFIKDCNNVYDKETRTKTLAIEYTDKLMFAKQYSSQTANKIISTYELDGFVYKLKEIVHRDLYRRWEVVREESWRVESGEVELYYARKVIQMGGSDADFIRRGKLDNTKYLTEDEAKILAKEKNQELLNYINRKI